MQIGSIRLGPDQRLTGQIDYHGRKLRLNLDPLPAQQGPSHQILLGGLATVPPSFAYRDQNSRNLTARLSVDQGATTLYLAFEPTQDGGYRISWNRPRSDARHTRRTTAHA